MINKPLLTVPIYTFAFSRVDNPDPKPPHCAGEDTDFNWEDDNKENHISFRGHGAAVSWGGT